MHNLPEMTSSGADFHMIAYITTCIQDCAEIYIEQEAYHKSAGRDDIEQVLVEDVRALATGCCRGFVLEFFGNETRAGTGKTGFADQKTRGGIR